MTVARVHHPGRLHAFLRHLGEMTAAMMVGMLAYGVIVGLVTAAQGSTIDQAQASQPELMVLLMATSMTVPMVAWMRHRGHDWTTSAEMSAAMFAAPVVLVVCYWLGRISATPICPIACAAMLPSMVVAMLWRLDLYTHRQLGPAG